MRGALVSSFLAVALAASGAEAQNYGGGFIELLMTGRDPGHTIRPVRPLYGSPLASDPFHREPRSPYNYPRVAALPGAPDGAPGIERLVDPRYLRQSVDYAGPHAAGTIIIDTPAKFLTLCSRADAPCATASASGGQVSSGRG
jgi:hypothetical protein